MIVAVTGGRHYDDYDCVCRELDQLHFESRITLILEGGARGADRLCRRWAISRGVPFKTFVAQWDRFGKKAGPLRNTIMLEQSAPNMLVAFPGGAGTGDCVRQAKQRDIRILFVTESE